MKYIHQLMATACMSCGILNVLQKDYLWGFFGLALAVINLYYVIQLDKQQEKEQE